MGNATAPVKESVPEPQTSHLGEGLGKFFSSTPTTALEKNNKPCCYTAVKIAFVVVAIINILLAIAVIAVTVSSAIAMRVFSSEQSSSLVAMILLAVLAAIIISITIYAMVAVLRNQIRPIHTAIILILILAVIQAIILGVSIPVTEDDEVKLSRSLSESFQLSKEHETRHVKLWAAIQYELSCCGVYSPEDYRNPNVPPLFAPDVTVSCCPGYDPDRSELVQERERQSCKAKKEYFHIGCRDPILQIYRSTSRMVITVVAILIICEVIISAFGIALLQKCKRKNFKEECTPEVVVKQTENPTTNSKSKS